MDEKLWYYFVRHHKTKHGCPKLSLYICISNECLSVYDSLPQVSSSSSSTAVETGARFSTLCSNNMKTFHVPLIHANLMVILHLTAILCSCIYKIIEYIFHLARESAQRSLDETTVNIGPTPFPRHSKVTDYFLRHTRFLNGISGRGREGGRNAI